MPKYTNWAPGEPNTVGPSYAYLNLHDGLWYDEIATATGHGTCEIRTETLNKIRGIIENSMGLFFEKSHFFSFLESNVKLCWGHVVFWVALGLEVEPKIRYRESA